MLSSYYQFFTLLEEMYSDLSALGIYLDYLSTATWIFIFDTIITLTFFILKGFGIYTLSKRAKLDKAFLAFIPFASFYQLGRVVGPMIVFKKRVKNLGLWVGILYFATFAIVNLRDYLLFYNWFEETIRANAVSSVAINETNLTELLYYLGSAVQLCYIVLFVFLVITFFNFYTKKNRFVFAILSVLFEPLFSIFVFVVRKNERLDYVGEMRRMQEYYENLHRQSQKNSQSGGDSPFSEYSKPPVDDDVFSEYSSKKQEEKPKNEDEEDLF